MKLFSDRSKVEPKKSPEENAPTSSWTPGGWENDLTPEERAVLAMSREADKFLNKKVIEKIRIPQPHES